MSATTDIRSVLVGLASALEAVVPATLANYATSESLTLPPIKTPFEARDDIDDPPPKRRPHLTVRQEPGREARVRPTSMDINYHDVPIEVVVTVDASNGKRGDAGSLAEAYARAVQFHVVNAARSITGVMTVGETRTLTRPGRTVGSGRGKRKLRQAIVRTTVHLRTTRAT